ncbi:MAG TPA: PDZ domain-containing protein, partial [Thermoanaerobaculia bacterium]|nr:PDZ domain-containing protein [Thermoanaerobaculia bacterium]
MRSGLCLCLCLLVAMGCKGKTGPEAGVSTLGAAFQNAESLRQAGVVLQEIVPEGPAAQAGLQEGDLILTLNGAPVEGACSIEQKLRGWYPGEEIELAVRRGPETLQKKVKLAGRDFLEEACEGGQPSGCYLLGGLHARGLEQERAAELFEKACHSGSPAACAETVGRHLQGISPIGDEAALLDIVRSACEDGSAAGCAHLAFLHATGRFVPQDDAQALPLFEKACDQGDANACYNAGLHFEQGRGTRKDPSRARAAYERACALGSSLGCTNLGFFHERGLGVRADVLQAAIAYRRACEGNPCDAGDPLA